MRTMKVRLDKVRAPLGFPRGQPEEHEEVFQVELVTANVQLRIHADDEGIYINSWLGSIAFLPRASNAGSIIPYGVQDKIMLKEKEKEENGN